MDERIIAEIDELKNDLNVDIMNPGKDTIRLIGVDVGYEVDNFDF